MEIRKPKRYPRPPRPTDQLYLAGVVGMLGWHGQIRGPARFRGVDFTAVVDVRRPVGPPGSGWLVGCLVDQYDSRRALAEASRFAGHCPRAVLIGDIRHTMATRVNAALLNIGVVLATLSGLQLLDEPGDVVPSRLRRADVWLSDPDWTELREAVDVAPVHATTQDLTS